MMQYCVLEVRKFYHLVIQGKKITAIALNSDFFPHYFGGTLFVYILEMALKRTVT